MGFEISGRYIDYLIKAKKNYNNKNEEWIHIKKDYKGYKCKFIFWINDNIGRKVEYTANTYKEVKDFLRKCIK